jgi:hypothetical protein
MTNINLDCFSHGQVKSKIWLCENLERFLPENSMVLILGSWVNVLGFMMLSRRPDGYSYVKGVDKDEGAVEIANKLCSYWYIEGIGNTVLDDANTTDTRGFNAVINCSSEHMENTTWFDNIPDGTLVCVQSSNITDTKDPWFVENPSPTIDSFKEKYPLRDIKFCDTLSIQYGDWGYDRYMIIGIK